MSEKVTQIVVVGGGAGGLELATKLGRRYRRNPGVDILLVDRHRTHIWKPLLHEVAAGSLDANLDEVGYGAHGHRWGFRFFLGTLEDIDRERREIAIAPMHDDDGTELLARQRICYDYLVMAVGSVSNDFGTPGVPSHCVFLDQRQDAERFRQRLLNHCLRVSRAPATSTTSDARVEITIVGNLIGGRMAVEGRLARFVYVSLYRMHLIAIHGWFRGALLIAIGRVNQVVRPRLKLH